MKRFYSIDTAKLWLKNLNKDTFPQNIFTLRFDRAQGPGGQNVNKINSKCTITLTNVSKCNIFPTEIKNQLFLKDKKNNNNNNIPHLFRYYSPITDTITVQADETRKQSSNRELCIEKLIKEIKRSCYFPEETSAMTKSKWGRIKQRNNEQRIKDKKHHSDKKKNRKVIY